MKKFFLKLYMISTVVMFANCLAAAVEEPYGTYCDDFDEPAWCRIVNVAGDKVDSEIQEQAKLWCDPIDFALMSVSQKLKYYAPCKNKEIEAKYINRLRAIRVPGSLQSSLQKMKKVVSGEDPAFIRWLENLFDGQQEDEHVVFVKDLLMYFAAEVQSFRGTSDRALALYAPPYDDEKKRTALREELHARLEGSLYKVVGIINGIKCVIAERDSAVVRKIDVLLEKYVEDLILKIDLAFGQQTSYTRMNQAIPRVGPVARKNSEPIRTLTSSSFKVLNPVARRSAAIDPKKLRIEVSQSERKKDRSPVSVVLRSPKNDYAESEEELCEARKSRINSFELSKGKGRITFGEDSAALAESRAIVTFNKNLCALEKAFEVSLF